MRPAGHHRQADRGRLHARRHRYLVGRDGGADPRRRRCTGMLMHNAYGYGRSPAASARITVPNGSAAPVLVSGGRPSGRCADQRPSPTSSTARRATCWRPGQACCRADPRKSSLELAFSARTSDRNAMRAEIEQTFDMDATDIYGLSEVIGPARREMRGDQRRAAHLGRSFLSPR